MGVSGRGMLYTKDNSTTESAVVREAVMGFRVRDTAAYGLSEAQRVQMLGQCTDLDVLTWITSTIRKHTLPLEHDPQGPSTPTQQWNTFVLDLPHLGDTPMPLPRGTPADTLPPHLAPSPLQWTPKY